MTTGTLPERLRDLLAKRMSSVNVGSPEDWEVHEQICEHVPALLSRLEALESALGELVHTKDEARKAEFGGPDDLASLMSKHAIAWQAARRLVEGK